MLLNIHVKNMALIEEADIDFTEGLNILTGETGAGKSILIGSINVALGSQGFKGFARDEAGSALVELVFSVENDQVREALKELDVPLESDEIIISRRLSHGRSISKINGETVPLTMVKKAAELLIDIHGQHEHQALLHQKNHLKILDEYAKETVEKEKDEVARLYSQYEECQRKLKETDLDGQSRAKEMDFLQFEINEIEEAALKTGEDGELEAEYRRLVNGQKITEALTEAYDQTGSQVDGASEKIGRALRGLISVSDFDETLKELTGQLGELDDLLNDFNREVKDYLESLSFDETNFSKVEERLNLINRLKGKYGKTIEEILEYRKEKEERLQRLCDYENYRSTLQRESQEIFRELTESCARVSRLRKEAAVHLKEEITAVLLDLNFLDVKFDIGFQEKQPSQDGFDEIGFLISMNPGQPLRPLQEVASGGELSRVMLAIKTVLADKDAVDAMIFDEIDVGISGRTAQKVSEKLAMISRSRQVLCITHLPQIASMADSHYVIEKKILDGTTKTSVRKLDEEESVRELARILGGAEITETVLKSAREMKELALSTKKY